MNGERYIVDIENRIVHDLDNESRDCHIDNIITTGHDMPYFSILKAILEDRYKGHHCTGDFVKMSS